MSYYWFNRKEILQKAEDKYHNCGGKERASECYIANKVVLKEKERNKYRNLSKKKKKQKGNIAETDTRKLKKNWKKNYKNELLLV